MFNYKIGYFSPEDSHYVELSHEKDLSKEELELLVFKATKFFFENLSEDNRKGGLRY